MAQILGAEMIDLKAIRAAAEADKGQDRAFILLSVDILALLDRLEAAEKDAARLNWLVDNDVDAAYLFATISGTFIRDTVDAAMGEQT